MLGLVRRGRLGLLRGGGWKAAGGVGLGYCFIFGLFVMDLEEEEAAKGKAKGSPGEELEESTWISGEEYGTNEREKECA